jgi:hypothetical protein
MCLVAKRVEVASIEYRLSLLILFIIVYHIFCIKTFFVNHVLSSLLSLLLDYSIHLLILFFALLPPLQHCSGIVLNFCICWCPCILIFPRTFVQTVKYFFWDMYEKLMGSAVVALIMNQFWKQSGMNSMLYFVSKCFTVCGALLLNLWKQKHRTLCSSGRPLTMKNIFSANYCVISLLLNDKTRTKVEKIIKVVIETSYGYYKEMKYWQHRIIIRIKEQCMHFF